jgi:hypothetical protein
MYYEVTVGKREKKKSVAFSYRFVCLRRNNQTSQNEDNAYQGGGNAPSILRNFQN